MGRQPVDIAIEVTFRLARLAVVVGIIAWLGLTIWEEFA